MFLHHHRDREPSRVTSQILNYYKRKLSDKKLNVLLRNQFLHHLSTLFMIAVNYKQRSLRHITRQDSFFRNFVLFVVLFLRKKRMISKCKLAIIKDFLSSHLKNNLFIIWRHGDRRFHARPSITFVSLLNSRLLCYVLIPVDVGGGDD